jgi:DNA-binding XRE family transcriptional regulator
MKARTTQRDRECEKPGTRYGRRVVISTDAIISGGVKYVGLWVRCDCGRTDLVRKSSLVAGVADQCADCGAKAKQIVPDEDQCRYSPGKLILHKRKLLGWTREHLAKVVGINSSTLYHIEKGRPAGWQIMVAIFDTVGIEVTLR